MSYTPGAWEIVREYNVMKGNMCVAACGGEDGSFIVADIRNDLPSSMANARLIAQSPSLLEALKSALETAEFEKHPFRPWHEQARQAIKLAEGE